MDIKLSICIPTYNRVPFLVQTLESVLSQMPSNVEVVVSDNASTDNTEEIVRAYQRRFLRLSYCRLETNLGMDRNFLNVVRQAQGEYCWLLSDDDVLEDGAIAVMLQYLNGSRPVDFLLVMYSIYDQSLEKALSSGPAELGLAGDLYTTDALRFFADFFREVCLSAYVIKREKWNRVASEKYAGTMLTQVGTVYDYLDSDSPIQVVAAPLVRYRGGNATWTHSTLALLTVQADKVLTLLPPRYDSVKKEAQTGFRRRFPVTLGMLARLRADGQYDPARYRTYVSDYLASRPALQTLAWLLAVTPPRVLKTLRRLRHQTTSAGRGS